MMVIVTNNERDIERFLRIPTKTPPENEHKYREREPILCDSRFDCVVVSFRLVHQFERAKKKTLNRSVCLCVVSSGYVFTSNLTYLTSLYRTNAKITNGANK